MKKDIKSQLLNVAKEFKTYCANANLTVRDSDLFCDCVSSAFALSATDYRWFRANIALRQALLRIRRGITRNYVSPFKLSKSDQGLIFLYFVVHCLEPIYVSPKGRFEGIEAIVELLLDFFAGRRDLYSKFAAPLLGEKTRIDRKAIRFEEQIMAARNHVCAGGYLSLNYNTKYSDRVVLMPFAVSSILYRPFAEGESFAADLVSQKSQYKRSGKGDQLALEIQELPSFEALVRTFDRKVGTKVGFGF